MRETDIEVILERAKELWPEAKARRLIQSYVDHYNTVRLHGCVTPQDMLAGRQAEIHAERDRKQEEARRQRQLRRLTAGTKTFSMMARVDLQG